VRLTGRLLRNLETYRGEPFKGWVRWDDSPPPTNAGSG
jgi:hypothetical protein